MPSRPHKEAVLLPPLSGGRRIIVGETRGKGEGDCGKRESARENDGDELTGSVAGSTLSRSRYNHRMIHLRGCDP